MNRLLLLLVLISASFAGVVEAQPVATTYYLQVIHGKNEAGVPIASAKPVGPKLGERLHSVFKWKYYWEIKRDSISVKPGIKSRKQLTPEREVELELVTSDQLALRIFKGGKLTRSITQSSNSQFFILGGDTAEEQSWFIVLRRDKPTEAPDNLSK